MSMGWRRVAIISETDAYGTGLTKAFRDQAQGTQLTIVLQQTFLLDALYNENSWDTILENIRSANVFVVIIFSESAHVVGLMPAIRAKGMMSSKYAWIGSDGMIGAIRQAPGLTVTFPSEGNGPAFAKFNELWDQHKMDINTTDKQNSLYSTKFVSCLELFLRGFDRYLRVTPGATLQRLAAGEYNPNFTSPATMFNFPEQYLPVGKILLDPTTGDPKSTYDIFNSQVVNGVATAVRVGSWDGISRNLTMDSPVTFGLEGSTIKPADDITLADYTSIVPSKSAMGALAIFFNMLAVGLIIAVGFVFHASRARPILRKSSIPSMNVVLVGLLLPCLDVFTMVDVPTKTQCIADIWLVGLGFAFVLGAIATKLLRLYRIFNGIQTQIKGVSNNDLLIQTGIPILIEAVLLTLWTANDPPTPKLIQVNPLSYYYVCSSRSASFQTMMTVSLVTWNGLLLIICTILAVATRDIRADFNEAKVVGLCVYNQLVIVTVALPLLTTGVGSVAISVLFAVKQAAILIVVFATVAAVHGTKIYALIVDKDLPKHAMRQIDSESQRPVPGAANRQQHQPQVTSTTIQTIAPRLTRAAASHPTLWQT
ncbi:7 transmembrane sweet-taste receptor of 3 GCPR-domain-containing protein [Entophlyctis helioformis]|nr:7 transmembrane sweet-taste receptor of 3 GCPR-domain-containing protein [Entophlyctis helioformis]